MNKFFKHPVVLPIICLMLGSLFGHYMFGNTTSHTKPLPANMFSPAPLGESPVIIEEHRSIAQKTSPLKKTALILKKLQTQLSSEDLVRIYQEILETDWGADYHSQKLAKAALMEKWSRMAPKQALWELRSAIHAGFSYGDDSRFFGHWATHSPQDAVEFYLENRIDFYNTSSIEGIITAWAASHPAEAWNWLQKAPIDNIEKLQGESGFYSVIMETNPDLFEKYILLAPPSAYYKESCITSYIRDNCTSHPDRILQWINTLPEKEKTHARQTYEESLAMQ